MIKPTININGSDRDYLVNHRMYAMDHIDETIESLKLVTPNGRDYPGDNDRCLADRQLHYERIAKLRAIYEELYAEALAIKAQRP